MLSEAANRHGSRKFFLANNSGFFALFLLGLGFIMFWLPSISPDQLQVALAQQDWQAADQANYELLLKIAGSKSKSQGQFDLEEWENLPCEKLKKIDILWRKASDKKFGFTAQLEIYKKVNYDAEKYYQEIGLKNEKEWLVIWGYNEEQKIVEYASGYEPNFTQKSLTNFPKGYLPIKMYWEDKTDRRLEKVLKCQKYGNWY
ncbi:MAG: GUN4 domain-containing protein [Geitlerinemataceae cyanobacterium]